eukprot:TRINITY_DN36388_c0_g1_i4.p1 TRINITY_DN36388_c0_g1~~TRINITY_DN36388_c0_g1_i4.p1  ORF type:complete len:682 (+),score=111.43 TRINITY_DN36388_c0_g1_i4:73-2118(+)
MLRAPLKLHALSGAATAPLRQSHLGSRFRGALRWASSASGDGNADGADKATPSSSSAGGRPEILSAAAANEKLAAALEALVAGSGEKALPLARELREAQSPMIRALARNAESLVLLRTAASPEGGGAEAAPGVELLAPWAEDGFSYGCTLDSIDEKARTCQVRWHDEGTSHRSVPLAALTTMQELALAELLKRLPTETRHWAARQSALIAVDEGNAMAEVGTAHDAFVDLVGFLCDAAAAEARAALLYPSHSWRHYGLSHARRHLQRARFMAERAWRPHSLALAVIGMHRAELMRLTAAASASPRLSANGDAMPTAPDRRRTFWQENVTAARDAAALHEQAFQHLREADPLELNFARDQEAAAPEGRSASWPLGGLPHHITLDILWAKALASVAASPSPKSARSQAARRSRKTRQVSLRADYRCKLKRLRFKLQSATGWSAPEKMVPHSGSKNPVGSEADSLLRLLRPHVGAMLHIWRALCMTAGRDMSMQHLPTTSFFETQPADARAIAKAALAVGEKTQSQGPVVQLLTEASILLFGMGCKLGHPGWARSLALPLAQAASEVIAEGDAQSGSGEWQVPTHLASAVLSGKLAGDRRSDYRPRSRQDALRHLKEALKGSSMSTRPRCRWSLLAYHADRELWHFAGGAGRVVTLAGPAPFTWCPEGLALLSEAAQKPGPGKS